MVTERVCRVVREPDGAVELTINPFERIVGCRVCRWIGFFGQLRAINDEMKYPRCPACRSNDWALVVSEGTSTLQ